MLVEGDRFAAVAPGLPSGDTRVEPARALMAAVGVVIVPLAGGTLLRELWPGR